MDEWITQSLRQAYQEAQAIAIGYDHAALTPEHLHLGLLHSEGSLIKPLLATLNIDVSALSDAVRKQLDGRLKDASGSTLYQSRRANQVWLKAKDIMASMHDTYLGPEHVYLGLLKTPQTDTNTLLKQYGITEESFQAALDRVR